MDIQNGVMMSDMESGQYSLKQNAPENLSGMQELPTISPLTYEIMEMADKKESAALQDMIDHPEIWKTLTNEEVLERVAMIHDRVWKELDAQGGAY